MRSRTRGEGLELVGGAPADFGAVLDRDIDRWRRGIREPGLKRDG